jgi:hypothetical protein
LNRIYGPNYDVFFNVRIFLKKITMNITPNVERENLKVRGDGNDIQLKIDDGNDIQLKIDKGNNMK